MIVLVGIDTENPLGAEMLTAKLDEPHPTSSLMTLTMYVSCCPGTPHDPGAPHAQVLSTETRGALGVHVDVVLPPDALEALLPPLLPCPAVAALIGERGRRDHERECTRGENDETKSARRE